ncbi:hypothetical protein A2215_02175 [Candidatus Berkelbacteria bacterium RIFOXYA2_FULL_43_10]|uniref:Uncharacterized protein n=1 Tax=Candidatus Berkelbacteria bacterium RIFOXYA2_FULL_43_10 TaxID=1797472 RepID=A0A1F5E3P5_9BACT|nr:MAG: hypothetical protein A2215_02175 [Candidatus Berkelbacteria bacterium RIFOXYA2_FULL_43_10]
MHNVPAGRRQQGSEAGRREAEGGEAGTVVVAARIAALDRTTVHIRSYHKGGDVNVPSATEAATGKVAQSPAAKPLSAEEAAEVDRRLATELRRVFNECQAAADELTGVCAASS